MIIYGTRSIATEKNTEMTVQAYFCRGAACPNAASAARNEISDLEIGYAIIHVFYSPRLINTPTNVDALRGRHGSDQARSSLPTGKSGGLPFPTLAGCAPGRSP
jgi:hypothetical protein